MDSVRNCMVARRESIWDHSWCWAADGPWARGPGQLAAVAHPRKQGPWSIILHDGAANPGGNTSYTSRMHGTSVSLEGAPPPPERRVVFHNTREAAPRKFRSFHEPALLGGGQRREPWPCICEPGTFPSGEKPAHLGFIERGHTGAQVSPRLSAAGDLTTGRGRRGRRSGQGAPRTETGSLDTPRAGSTAWKCTPSARALNIISSQTPSRWCDSRPRVRLWCKNRSDPGRQRANPVRRMLALCQHDACPGVRPKSLDGGAGRGNPSTCRPAPIRRVGARPPRARPTRSPAVGWCWLPSGKKP